MTPPPERTERSDLPRRLPDVPTDSLNPGRTDLLAFRDRAPSSSDQTQVDTTRPARAVDDPSAPGYEYDTKVGSGGFGEVWRGRQRALRRVIAIKRIREDLRRELEDRPEERALFEEAFRQEAIVGASLDHPNILPIHDMARDADGHPILAMKFVRGVVWDRLVQQDFPALSVEAFLARHVPILVGVAQAVAFAHARGIVHRDLKPSQVMVGDFGEVLLMDWGLAVVFDEPSASASMPDLMGSGMAPTLDTATNPSGTAAFMAPEQTEPSARGIGTHTDVYLLGGILYYLLTGRVPHPAADARSAFLQAVAGEVPAPSERAPGREMPPHLVELAMRSMAPAPRDRTGSAVEFIAALKDFLSGEDRRRESERIAEEVSRRLEGRPNDYRVLSEMNTQLVRAQGLWPGNERARLVQQRVMMRFARTALQYGDTRLAAVLAGQVNEETTRAKILEEVATAEARLDRGGRQRKVLLVVLAGLLVAVTMIAGTANQRSIDATGARLRLGQGLERAESFMNVTLRELKSGLEPIGRLDLIEPLADRSTRYYAELPADVESPAGLLARAEAYLDIGDVLGSRGRFDESLSAYVRARDYARELVSRDEMRMAWQNVYLNCSERVARTLERQGRYADAATLHGSAAESARLLLQLGAPERSAIATRVARNYNAAARCHWRLGTDTEAVDAWKRSARELEALQMDPATAETEALALLATALLRLGRVEDARPLAAELVARRYREDPEFLKLCVDAGLAWR